MTYEWKKGLSNKNEQEYSLALDDGRELQAGISYERAMAVRLGVYEGHEDIALQGCVIGDNGEKILTKLLSSKQDELLMSYKPEIEESDLPKKLKAGLLGLIGMIEEEDDARAVASRN